jgi:hypothetical protein
MKKTRLPHRRTREGNSALRLGSRELVFCFALLAHQPSNGKLITAWRQLRVVRVASYQDAGASRTHAVAPLRIERWPDYAH